MRMYASSLTASNTSSVPHGQVIEKVEAAVRVAVCSIYLTLENVLSTLIGVLGYAYTNSVITPAEMGLIAGIALLASFIQIIVNLGLNPRFHFLLPVLK